MSRNTKSSSTIPEDEEAHKLSFSSMSSSSSEQSSRKPSSREPSISSLSVSSNKERKKITEKFKKEQEEWREKQEKELIFREGNEIQDRLHKARKKFKQIAKETRGMIDEIRNVYHAKRPKNDGYDGEDEETSIFNRRKKRRTKQNKKGGKKKTKKRKTIKKKDIFKYLPDSIEYHRKNYK